MGQNTDKSRPLEVVVTMYVSRAYEREKDILLQKSQEGTDSKYERENLWISGGLYSIRRRRQSGRRLKEGGVGGGEVGEKGVRLSLTSPKKMSRLMLVVAVDEGPRISVRASQAKMTLSLSSAWSWSWSCLSSCIQIYIYTYIYIHTHISIYTYMYTHIKRYVNIHENI